MPSSSSSNLTLTVSPLANLVGMVNVDLGDSWYLVGSASVGIWSLSNMGHSSSRSKYTWLLWKYGPSELPRYMYLPNMLMKYQIWNLMSWMVLPRTFTDFIMFRLNSSMNFSSSRWSFRE